MFSTDFEEVARTHTTAEKRATQHLSSNWDDAEGYYKLTMGEVIDGRYVVSAFMGSGVFSGVVRALDRRNKDAPVAIKILRNNDLMYKAGLKELAVCQSLQAADPDGRAHCVRFIRSLTHRNHLCLIFEALGLNLRDVCRRYGRDHGLNIRAVRAYTGQLLQALRLMHSIGHLHADIKPDNILVNEAKNVCKLADFGSAFPVEENDPTPYLASRYYRAPEIILGHRYSYGADMWALACTLYELATGQILFAGTSNNDMLRAILELCNRPSLKFLRRGQFYEDHFDQDARLLYRETDDLTGNPKVTALDMLRPTRNLMRDLRAGEESHLGSSERRLLSHFKDLLEKMLLFDSDKRIQVHDALRHPFLTDVALK